MLPLSAQQQFKDAMRLTMSIMYILTYCNSKSVTEKCLLPVVSLIILTNCLIQPSVCGEMLEKVKVSPPFMYACIHLPLLWMRILCCNKSNEIHNIGYREHFSAMIKAHIYHHLKGNNMTNFKEATAKLDKCCVSTIIVTTTDVYIHTNHQTM